MDSMMLFIAFFNRFSVRKKQKTIVLFLHVCCVLVIHAFLCCPRYRKKNNLIVVFVLNLTTMCLYDPEEGNHSRLWSNNMYMYRCFFINAIACKTSCLGM